MTAIVAYRPVWYHKSAGRRFGRQDREMEERRRREMQQAAVAHQREEDAGAKREHWIRKEAISVEIRMRGQARRSKLHVPLRDTAGQEDQTTIR